MSDNWLDLELPANAGHPSAPWLPWDQYVAWLDERIEVIQASGRLAELLGDFAETHCGEPFVMHD